MLPTLTWGLENSGLWWTSAVILLTTPNSAWYIVVVIHTEHAISYYPWSQWSLPVMQSPWKLRGNLLAYICACQLSSWTVPANPEWTAESFPCRTAVLMVGRGFSVSGRLGMGPTAELWEFPRGYPSPLSLGFYKGSIRIVSRAVSRNRGLMKEVQE